MKNNKGFSLVELIIVIAIMAILVGVMAPQLIKYIEKTNVSSDAQVCDSIRSAITTAMLDPEVVNAKTPGLPTLDTNGKVTAIGEGEFKTAVNEILGLASTADPSAETNYKFKSHVGSSTASGLTIIIKNGNAVSVYLSTSDPSGKKSTTNTAKIGAGPDCPQ